MTISMTAAGLAEINGSYAVYTKSDMISSGYSDCSVRVTYSEQIFRHHPVSHLPVQI